MACVVFCIKKTKINVNDVKINGMTGVSLSMSRFCLLKYRIKDACLSELLLFCRLKEVMFGSQWFWQHYTFPFLVSQSDLYYYDLFSLVLFHIFKLIAH